VVESLSNGGGDATTFYHHHNSPSWPSPFLFYQLVTSSSHRAGGARSLDDLKVVESLSNGRGDATTLCYHHNSPPWPSPSLFARLVTGPSHRAGGARSLDDLELVESLSNGRVDVTVGSALDIFGGKLSYAEVCEWDKRGLRAERRLKRWAVVAVLGVTAVVVAFGVVRWRH
jgi:hypothetical protein